MIKLFKEVHAARGHRTDEAIVEQALYLASIAKDSKKVHDYADTEHRYLVLRLRGSRVGWFVRAKRRMKRIGNGP